MQLASSDCDSIPSYMVDQYVLFNRYGRDDDTRFEIGTCFSIAISNSKALFASTGGSPVCVSSIEHH